MQTTTILDKINYDMANHYNPLIKDFLGRWKLCAHNHNIFEIRDLSRENNPMSRLDAWNFPFCRQQFWGHFSQHINHKTKLLFRNEIKPLFIENNISLESQSTILKAIEYAIINAYSKAKETESHVSKHILKSKKIDNEKISLEVNHNPFFYIFRKLSLALLNLEMKCIPNFCVQCNFDDCPEESCNIDNFKARIRHHWFNNNKSFSITPTSIAHHCELFSISEGELNNELEYLCKGRGSKKDKKHLPIIMPRKFIELGNELVFIVKKYKEARKNIIAIFKYDRDSKRYQYINHWRLSNLEPRKSCRKIEKSPQNLPQQENKD